jgi:hypothetical protein
MTFAARRAETMRPRRWWTGPVHRHRLELTGRLPVVPAEGVPGRADLGALLLGHVEDAPERRRRADRDGEPLVLCVALDPEMADARYGNSPAPPIVTD